MTKRRKWTAIPGLIALATAAILLSAYSGASSSQGSQPQQPINFPHTVHVQRLGMNCLYCHYTANKSPDPGLPAVSTCMGCHLIIGPTLNPVPGVRTAAYKSPELEKLVNYYKGGAGKPVPWVRIHKVPEYVHFPHMRHVNAGVTCQTCHGKIQEMPQVYQYSSLNMGWCISCHVNGYSAQEGEVAAGYARIDSGVVTPAGSPQQATAATSANAQQQQPTSTIAVGRQPAKNAAGRSIARYDCANCHY
jgi:cytochrome c7-like protein